MLVKEKFEAQLETIFKEAMTDAIINSINTIRRSSDSAYISDSQVAEVFSNEFKTCAHKLADAIDSYIRSATITMNMGTTIIPMPTLTCSAGPVSGSITLASPTTLLNSIS